MQIYAKRILTFDLSYVAVNYYKASSLLVVIRAFSKKIFLFYLLISSHKTISGPYGFIVGLSNPIL